MPVLLYHRLLPERGAVAPADFEAQMRRLHELGFEAITLDSYVRFMRGERVHLPRRPILITFDDASVSSWKNSDAVLARYGWTAVMYVPTGFVGVPGHLTWDELRQMQASGRWQIEEHAGYGHVYIPVDAAGAQMPFYAAERFVGGMRESFAAYRRRVSHDIELGAEMLRRHLPGWRTHGTFAVPYGDYGQRGGRRGSNDPRIGPWFSSFLKAHFAVIFLEAPDTFTTPGLGFADRIPVPGAWDAALLESHLLLGVHRLALRTGSGRGGG